MKRAEKSEILEAVGASFAANRQPQSLNLDGAIGAASYHLFSFFHRSRSRPCDCPSSVACRPYLSLSGLLPRLYTPRPLQHQPLTQASLQLASNSNPTLITAISTRFARRYCTALRLLAGHAIAERSRRY